MQQKGVIFLLQTMIVENKKKRQETLSRIRDVGFLLPWFFILFCLFEFVDYYFSFCHLKTQENNESFFVIVCPFEKKKLLCKVM